MLLTHDARVTVVLTTPPLLAGTAGGLNNRFAQDAYENGRYPVMHQIYEVALLGGWDDEGQGMEGGSKAHNLIKNILTHISNPCLKVMETVSWFRIVQVQNSLRQISDVRVRRFLEVLASIICIKWVYRCRQDYR